MFNASPTVVMGLNQSKFGGLRTCVRVCMVVNSVPVRKETEAAKLIASDGEVKVDNVWSGDLPVPCPDGTGRQARFVNMGSLLYGAAPPLFQDRVEFVLNILEESTISLTPANSGHSTRAGPGSKREVEGLG